MPPRGSQAYLAASGKLNDFRIDPRLAEDYSARQERLNQERLAQLAQHGDILASGISQMGDVVAQGIDNAARQYNAGKQRRMEADAHAVRMANSQREADRAKAEDEFWSTKDPASGMKRGDRMRQLQMLKAEDDAKGGKVPQTAQWDFTGKTDTQGRPILYNRITGEEKTLSATLARDPSTVKTREIVTYDDKGNQTIEIVEDRPGLKRTSSQKPSSKSSSKEEFEALPMDKQVQVKTLATKVGNYKSAASVVKSGLVEFQKAKTKDDQIRIGQSMLKEMNSLVGSDAVGAEEVKRLGSALEYNLLNITGPGPIHGRDLKGFETQAFSAISRMDNASLLSENEIDKIYGRASAKEAAEPIDPSIRLKSKGSAIAAPLPNVSPPPPENDKDPESMTDEERAEELKRLRGQ